ncbi:MAG: M50 family metallopeptidase [Fimbriimonadaceae bacterium]|nr:M50 family metallopeptidase [Fimbriimonadaceae bacterium]
MTLKRRRGLLLMAAGLSVLMWLVPFGGLLLYPLLLLNTHLHELFHAVAGIAGGGSVDRILVNADGSGLALVRGGPILVVASAGYVGTAVLGGLLILGSRSELASRTWLKVLAVGLAGSMVFLVRGDLVGLLFGALWAPALWFLAAKLQGDALAGAVQFLGVQLALTSLAAFRALFAVSTQAGHSDAALMRQATGIPDVVWATLWLGLSLAVLWGTLKTAWNEPGGVSPRSSEVG